MTDVDVVVVGAGLAGLSAAAAAAAAGYSVVVLEARDRIGGRIDTRRLPTGAVAELGAQVVHGSQNQLLDLPGVLGRAAPIDRSDVQATWVLAGERHGFEEAEAEFCSPTVVAERLRALHARLRPLGLHTLALSQALDMLAVSAPARRAVEGWYEQVTGSPAADVPLAEVASDRVYQYHGDAECEISDGLATIADQLGVGLDVRTSCPVTELTLTGAGGGGVLVVCAGGQHWSGRRAVLAVPPSVVAAGAMRIDALDDAHRTAAAELVLCDAVAVAVGLARPAPADAFVFDADGELGFVTVRRGGRHLIAIAKGSVAQRLRGLAEDPRRLVARLQLALPSCSLTADAECWTHDWGRDPWAHGAFTAPTVASRAASKRWSRPIGNRIFPAGEATACGDGAPFLDRAYRSGAAAVRELMAGLEVAQLQVEVA